MPQTPAAAPSSAPHRAMALGLLGVALFALTFPMTRLAVGSLESPQLPPLFVSLGRAAVAGGLSLLWLLAVRARLPRRAEWPALLVGAAGTVFGFPLAVGFALREVPAMHGAVVSGVLPLFTAALAALVLRQRARAGFWWSAPAGCALVLTFAVLEGGGRPSAADAWLLLALVCAAVGYVAGAHLSAHMPAEQVVCWTLIISLPITLPGAWVSWPVAPASPAAWGGFAYVSVVSMWLGFFAWYRALHLGGALRVSQLQLLQPFLALLSAVPLLGEPLRPATLGFALAVLVTVWLGRRQAMPPSATPAMPLSRSPIPTKETPP